MFHCSHNFGQKIDCLFRRCQELNFWLIIDWAWLFQENQAWKNRYDFLLQSLKFILWGDFNESRYQWGDFVLIQEIGQISIFFQEIKVFLEVINNVFDLDDIAGKAVFTFLENMIALFISLKKLHIFHDLTINSFHFLDQSKVREMRFSTILNSFINLLKLFLFTLKFFILGNQFRRQSFGVCSDNFEVPININWFLETYWTHKTVFIGTVTVTA